MVVFISDLHISDRTSGLFHLPAKAFRIAFKHLAALAHDQEEEKLNIVLLGDTFDLIHTEYWWPGPPADQAPWGERPSPACAEEALQRIITQGGAKVEPAGYSVADDGTILRRNGEEVDRRTNEAVFALFQLVQSPEERRKFLGPELPDGFKRDLEIDVTYVPGNHDRLCNWTPRTRQMVIDALGLSHDAREPFPWQFSPEGYRVFATHGHQLDAWNAEPGSVDQLPATPIGDVLTAMLVSKLPRLVTQALRDSDSIADPAELERIHHNLHAMFDVRPFAALIPWLSYQAEGLRKNRLAREVFEKAIDRTIDDFLEIPFVKKWLRKYRFGRGAKLGLLLKGLRRVSLLSLDRVAGLIQRGVDWTHSSCESAYPRRAAELMRELDVDYVVFGHTHAPLQVPIAMGVSGRFYLNTGTWRPRYERTSDERGFVAVKGLTYSVVYSRRPSKKRAREAEAWTGMLKDRDV